MNLVLFTAITAVCSAAKLDKTYLPPASAKTAGGSPGFLQTPLTRSSDEVPIGLPAGGYNNAAEGVVVDAAIAGTRNSPDSDQSGLGGPRTSYGSTASKVGDAAFRGSLSGFNQFPTGFDRSLPVDGRPPGLHRLLEPERPEASKDRNSNTLSYENNVDIHNYNYGFETDNGIAVGENGVAQDGVHAQGGYSYKGDDGKVYSVTYTADKEGYKPQGSHLPTPPPIPDEIQKSIEQNAKEEAAGVVDDGSYDAQKYNAEGDYTESDSNKHVDKLDSQFAKRPESSGTSIGTSINQNQPTSGFIGNTGLTSHGLTANRPHTVSGYKPLNSFNNGQFFGHNTQHSSAANVDQNISTQGLGSESNFEQSGQNSQTDIQSSLKPQFDQGQTGSDSQLSTGFQFNQQGFKPHFGVHSTKPLIGHQPVISDSSSLSSSQITQESSQTGVQPSQPSGTHLQPFGENQLLQGNQDASALENAAVSTQYSDEIQNHQYDSQSGTTVFGKPIQPGQGSSNSFASTGQFGNTFGVTNNEYLPPSNIIASSGKPALNSTPQKPSYASISPPASAISQLNSAEKPSGFQPQPSQTHHTSSQNSASETYFNSGASHTSGAHSSQSFNVQAQQSSNIYPGQFPQNTNTQISSSQGHTEFNNPNLLVSHSQPNHGAQFTQTGSGVTNTRPTAVPQLELTTPVEPYKQSQNSGNFPSPTGPTNLATFIPQTSSAQSTQSHFGSQSDLTKPSSSSQSQTSSLLTSSTQNSNFPPFGANSPQPQLTISNQLISGKDEIIQPAISSDKKPQNELSQGGVSDVQYASSTQKPTYGQQSQGISNSYYYNQPSKPFSTPQSRPQGSKFPTAPSNQFNTITAQQISQNSGDFSDKPASRPAHPDTLSGSTQYPNKQTLSPVVSTSSIQKESTFTHTSHSGVTQAAISPFSSGSPTPTTQHNIASGSKPTVQQPIKQFNQGQFSSFPANQQSNSNQPKPSQQGLPQKPLNQFGLNPNFFQEQAHVGQVQAIKPLGNQYQLGVSQVSNTQTNPTQHHTGAIYEYTKPLQELPVPSYQANVIPNNPVNAQSLTKPQFGQTQSTQTSTHFQTQTSQVQKESTSHLFVQPATPQISQTSQSNPTNTGINSLKQPEQNSRPQFAQAFKPFGTTSQFSAQSSKPQFGQNIQTSYGSLHSANSEQQNSQTGFSQFSTQPSKPLSTSTNSHLTSSIQSQLTGQPEKPQLSQTSQQTSNFGSQPSFGQNLQSTQGSTATSSSLESIQSSLTPLGNQPLKPFGATLSNFSSYSHGSQPAQGSKPQFSTQPSKTPFTQNTGSVFGTTYNSGSNTHQQSSPISHNQFGTQPLKPFGSNPLSTTSFGVQQTKPQFGQNTLSNYGSTQTSSKVPTSQQQPGKGSQAQFGLQPFKPYGSTPTTSVSSPVVSQFGVQPTKTQFGQTLQPTQSSAYASSSSTQEQTTLDSQPQLGHQPYRPFGSALAPFGSQFHSQPTKTQFGQTFQPTQSSAYASSSASNTEDQATLGSRPQFGTIPYTPFGIVPSHYGTQTTKTQYGQNPQPAHSSAYASSSASSTQEQSTLVSQPQFSSLQYKPFGSAQLTPVSIPTISQFGTQPTKTQFGQNLQPTHSSAYASSSVSNTQEESSLISQPQFGSQQFKPFGSAQSTPVSTPTVSQFGTSSTKTQFGQKLQPTHSSAYASSSVSNTQEESSLISQPQFGSQQFKPFGSAQSTPVSTPTVSQFGASPTKTQFGQKLQPTHSSAYAISSTSNTQEQSSHTHQPQFASHQFKPFGSAQLTPITTTTVPQPGTQPTKIQFAQNVQPAQSSAYASSSSSQEQPADSRPHFVQGSKPFNAPVANSVQKTQFGIQTSPSFGQNGQATEESAHESHSQQTTHGFQSQLNVQPVKPFSNTVGISTQHTQLGSKPQISQTAQTKPLFGTSLNQASYQSSSSHSSNVQNLKPDQAGVGKGEKFGGPREPPRFDDKTGYHY